MSHPSIIYILYPLTWHLLLLSILLPFNFYNRVTIILSIIIRVIKLSFLLLSFILSFVHVLYLVSNKYNISWEVGLAVTDSFTFCLYKKFLSPLLFWKAVFLGIIFLVGSHFSFSTLNISSHSLVSLQGYLLKNLLITSWNLPCIKHLTFLTAFTIVSLLLLFTFLI